MVIVWPPASVKREVEVMKAGAELVGVDRLVLEGVFLAKHN